MPKGPRRGRGRSGHPRARLVDGELRPMFSLSWDTRKTTREKQKAIANVKSWGVEDSVEGFTSPRRLRGRFAPLPPQARRAQPRRSVTSPLAWPLRAAAARARRAQPRCGVTSPLAWPLRAVAARAQRAQPRRGVISPLAWPLRAAADRGPPGRCTRSLAAASSRRLRCRFALLLTGDCPGAARAASPLRHLAACMAASRCC